jgi:microcystin-dependent protein
MASPYLSQITMFAGNFAPKNYALCNGQLLAINQNAALFALLGTMYGGNGTTNFALPNLQSALPMSFGQGAGLSNYVQGQVGGFTSVTLTQQTVPSHQHFMLATKSPAATSASISTSLLPGAPPVSGGEFYANPPQPGQPALIPHPLAAATCSTVGNNQAHTNMMPSLCITFCIALSGVFPSRN